MTGKAPYISLAIAIVLGIATWWVTRPVPVTQTEGAPPTGPIAPGDVAFAIDPATVVAITRAAPGERDQTVRRQDDGRWLFDMPGGDQWPTDSQAIYAFLRSASQARATGAADRDASPGEAIAVRFTAKDGAQTMLSLARAPLGGNRIITVRAPDDTERTAMINARFAAQLVDPGPVAWRLPQAIPGMGRNVSRVALDATDGRIELARPGGAWSIVAPFAAPADRESVETLLDVLARIEVHEFQSGPVREALLEGGLTIDVARDVRIIGDDAQTPEISTRRRTLVVGQVIDPQAGTHYAAASTGDASARLPMTITFAGLHQQAMLDPLSYVTRTPLTTAPSLVRAIDVSSGANGVVARFAKGVNGWELRGEDGELERLLTAEQSTSLDQLLTSLSTPTTPALDKLAASDITLTFRNRDRAPLVSILLSAEQSAAPVAHAHGAVYILSRPLPPVMLEALGR